MLVKNDEQDNNDDKRKSANQPNEEEQKKLEIKKLIASILKDKSNEPLNKIKNIM